jgi:hypothetical protein
MGRDEAFVRRPNSRGRCSKMPLRSVCILITPWRSLWYTRCCSLARYVACTRIRDPRCNWYVLRHTPPRHALWSIVAALVRRKNRRWRWATIPLRKACVRMTAQRSLRCCSLASFHFTWSRIRRPRCNWYIPGRALWTYGMRMRGAARCTE